MLLPTCKLLFPVISTVDSGSSNVIIGVIFLYSFGILTVYSNCSFPNSGDNVPSFTSKFIIFELSLSFLVTFIWYVFVFPASAVTITFISFSPTSISCLPKPITLDKLSASSPSTSTYVTSFSTSNVYSTSSLSNSGLISYPLTYKSFKSTFDENALLTINVHVNSINMKLRISVH